VGESVQGLSTCHPKDSADLQMVLQVFSDAFEGLLHGNTQAREQGTGPDAGQLEDLWRADGTRSHDNAPAGPGRQRLASRRLPLHSAAPQKSVAVPVHQQATNMGPRDNTQVGSASRRTQESLGRVPSHTRTLVDFEIADTFVAAGIEVIRGGYAGLLRGLLERRQDVPAQALLLHAPLGTGPMLGAAASPMVFVAAKDGQTVLPTPRELSGNLGPEVVVPRLSPHVDHAVDARASTEHFPPGITQAPAVQARLTLSLVAPIGSWVANAIQVSDRNVDPRIVVFATCLQQQNPAARIRAESIGQQTPCGAAAHNNMVKNQALV
jgi:hypothetical protein